MNRNRTAIMAVVFFLAQQAAPLFGAGTIEIYSPNSPVEIASSLPSVAPRNDAALLLRRNHNVGVNEILKGRAIKPQEFHPSSPVETSL